MYCEDEKTRNMSRIRPGQYDIAESLAGLPCKQ